MDVTSNESLVQDVCQSYEYELDKWKDLRETSEENYNYVRGEQWVRYEKEAEKLRKKGVPVLNLNLILPVVTVIIGYQIRHRYDLKAYPIKQTPQILAELITRLIKYTGLRSKLIREMSQATLDALIANIGGYLAIDWTNESDPLGEFIIKRESPFYHLRDSANERYDINFGNHHLRTKWLTSDDLKAIYPKRKQEIENFIQFKSKRNWIDHISSIYSKVTKKKEPSKWDYVNEKDGLYRVVELWELERKDQRILWNLRTDKMLELNGKSEPIARELIKDRRDFTITNKKRKELKVTTVLGGVELLVDKQLYDIQIGKFPFMNIFTHWIDGEPLSNVENLKDYQDEHNKRSGNILQILNSTANSGWWVKRLSDGELSTRIEDLMVGGSRFGFVGEYKGSQPPQKIEPNHPPVGHQYMDENTRRGIRETSMIGENMQGREESSGESGRLFQKRVDQGSIALEMFFENLRNSYELIGDYEVKAFPKKYSKERIFSIAVDDGNFEEFRINTGVLDDITSGNYSVTLVEVDHSPTAKTQRFMELQAMAASMPPELVHFPTIIRQSPFEGKETMAQYAEMVMNRQMQTMANGEQTQQQQMENQQYLDTIKELTNLKKVTKEEKKIN